MVLGMAAEKLADVANVVGARLTREKLAPKWLDLCRSSKGPGANAASPQEFVRINAFKSAHAIFKHVAAEPTGPLAAEVGDMYQKAASDVSWRVRQAVGETLADVANATPKELTGPLSTKVFQSIFDVLLAREEKPEVRYATAACVPGAARRLGPDWAATTLFPKIKAMIVEEEETPEQQKVMLAGALMEMADPLGKDKATELFSSLLEELTAEAANTNQRLMIITKLPALWGVVGADPKVLQLVVDLIKDKNWRVRHETMLKMRVVARTYDAAQFKSIGWMDLATDNVALIREDWVKCCIKIAHDFSKAEASHGAAWLEDNVIKILKESAENKDYRMKTVLLSALTYEEKEEGDTIHLFKYLPSETRDMLVDLAKGMLKDSVPNLRIQAAKALGIAAQHVAQAKVTAIMSQLKELKGEEEKDIDVLDAVKQALGKMGA